MTSWSQGLAEERPKAMRCNHPTPLLARCPPALLPVPGWDRQRHHPEQRGQLTLSQGHRKDTQLVESQDHPLGLQPAYHDQMLVKSLFCFQAIQQL